MGLLGSLMLYGAVASIVVMLVVGVQAGRTGSVKLARTTEHATLALSGFATAAVIVLETALATLDFHLAYVGEYTSVTLSVPYRIGSMWAGQGGSLLLWAWIISLGAGITVIANRRRGLGLSPWVFVVFALCASLFVFITTFLQSPFIPATQQIIDGAGLNPLLQDPLQLIHPLFLYSGYVLITVPFAVVMGSLIAGNVSGPWLDYARLWAVLSWTSLSIGMLLGARWAYAELGWGGYWAWDPVENASLIPWLAGTALLHTGLTHRDDRSRAKLSSLALLATVFNLCLFGTFLTRSGVIQSVHAFGISNLGPVLGAAIVVSVIGSAGVLVWRLPELQHVDSRRRARGWLGQLLLVNLLILMTVSVLWGTLYPLFARAFLGREVAVTPGFFKTVVTPMGLGLLLLFAVSPLLRSQRVPNAAREATVRAVMFVAVFLAAVLLGTTWLVALVLALSALSMRTVLAHTRPKLGAALRRGEGRARRVLQAGSPYVAHVGLIVLLAAITVNVTGETKQQVKLYVGSSAVAAGQLIRLDDARLNKYPDRQSLVATMSLLNNDGTARAQVVAAVDAFPNSDQPHTQVGIASGLQRDIYVVIDGWPTDPNQGVPWLRISVYDNPAINWVWFGGGLIGLGGLLYVLSMRPRRRRLVIDSAALDQELNQLISSAIVAVRADVQHTSNERVNALINTARDLNGGEAAPVDHVVSFLERARGGSGPSTPPAGRPRFKRGRAALAALLALALVGASGYLLGHSDSSASSTAAATSIGSVDKAQLAALMQRLAKNPRDVDAYAQLGALYFNAGGAAANAGNSAVATPAFQQASVFFEKRAALMPNDVTAWLDAGAAAIASQNRLLAFTNLGRALKLAPDNQLAHFDLGILYLNDVPSQPDKARAEFAKVVAIDPNSNIGRAAAQRIGGTTNLSPSGTKAQK